MNYYVPSRMMRVFAVWICCLSALVSGQARDCGILIKGMVMDSTTNSPIPAANVLIEGHGGGAITDDEGGFAFEGLCEGEYQLTFSYIGYGSKTVPLRISKDTLLEISLMPTDINLVKVVVVGKEEPDQPHVFVSKRMIEENAQQNLSTLLANETGVHVIKNGNGIAKPMVHGLYGNRLTILNNGIRQGGQQWGNDHSPEIDPLSADKITVLKGANAIEYGNNTGSVILVEPRGIKQEDRLRGRVNYTFETNGRGSGLNIRLQKHSPRIAWRVNGTLKMYGDRKTPDYFLNNTGGREANFSVQLQKSWKEKLFLDIYSSTFNAQLGVLRGAHVGNTSDLEEALGRDEPFFTEDRFSYGIEAPRQAVSHHLLKANAKYFLGKGQSFRFVLAGQMNNREEFDVRRNGRTDIPMLSLDQYTAHLDVVYQKDFKENWTLRAGNQNTITDNTNDPETGVLPLIPDYISWASGWFATLSKELGDVDFNLGGRYDYEKQKVVTITPTMPREILRYENDFQNASGVAGLRYGWSDNQSLAFQSGYAMRNPAVNELYSYGLHQGVSGIEEGDVSLGTEKSIKTTLEYEWTRGERFYLGALAYHQWFDDYIFLNPQDEIQLTIHGAFPVFKYEQTDARIYGFDVSARCMMGKFALGSLKYSFIRGDDTSNDMPLVYMPPNRLSGGLVFRADKAFELSPNLSVERLEMEVKSQWVFGQNHWQSGQDFVPPPATYHLLGLRATAGIASPKGELRLFANADNLLNTRYRDYLNRLRYFADELGFSLTLGVNFSF